MPENLPPDSLSSRRFLRTCYKMLSIIANHNYTKLEMQYSITDAIFNMKSYGLCVEEYGVAERTLRRHISNICAAYGCVNRRHLHDKCRDDVVLSTSVIAHISVICYESHMDPIPYFDQVEIDLFFSMSNERKILGMETL